MIRRAIGRNGRQVNAIGLGCMGISFAYGPAMPEDAAVKLLHEAIALGVDHFDTAEMYGLGHNEKVLGAAFHDRRDKVFIATKFGPLMEAGTGRRLGVDGSEANARRALEQSLKSLRTDHVDLWYLHRRDFSRPIEETVGAMSRLVEEGKVRAIGLSEVTAPTLRAAAKVAPIAALQSEYSIFSRFIEADILPACRELGTTLVAYSPLGRGMLTGAFKKDWKPEGMDFRAAMQPRYQGDNFEANLALVSEIEKIAGELKATAGQVALAWVLAQGDDVVVIPGTTKLANLKDNLASGEVRIGDAQMARLNALAAKVQGDRYDEAGMKAVNG